MLTPRPQAEATRAAEVERTKIEYLDKQGLDANRRREALAAERNALDVTTLGEALARLTTEHDQQRAALDGLGDQLDERKKGVATVQEQQRQLQADLAEARKHGQSARGRLASLEALQHAALGQEKGAAQEWLVANGLDRATRLGEALDVDAGWETAVETVLGSLLEAATVDAPEGLLDAGRRFRQGPPRAALERCRRPLHAGRFARRAGCADRVRRGNGWPRFASPTIWRKRAPSSPRWLRTKPSLPALANGWGPGWLRVIRSGEAQQGSLLREREIQSLRGEIDSLAKRETQINEQITGLRDKLLEAEQQREDAQRSLYLAHRGVAELAGQLQSQQGRLESAQTRLSRIDAELAQLTQTLTESQQRTAEARAAQERAVARMGDLETERQQLDTQRRALSEQRDAARNAARDVRDSAHQLALTLETKRTQVTALSQALSRMGGQRSQLDARKTELAVQLADGDAPIRKLDAERQAYLDQRVLVEKDLAAARSGMEGVEAELRRYEQQRQKADQQAVAVREVLGTRRLQEQAVALKAQSLGEAIVAAGLVLDEVLAALPEQAEADAWQKSLADLEHKIRRLEPVNLAAIQEYGEQSQRKEYLDAQNADLVTALDALETAIKKIDRETRGRFKDTFDRVNAGVQELFPRLFGGGHAYLELTGEDLLDTGIAIIARPPGKRPSNISLLSGGEKALTAVSLVFAIFRLNPAPFCLLDEVDAPLDEANVGRFCAMVSEMSEKVQFLFVTHNKATMEAALQLAGVTMREPGVSRLVSVDLAEATRLAGAA
jgi:chromosome segregation protein